MLSWLAATSFSLFMQSDPWAFPVAESVHVAALALTLGTVGLVDLRLLGWAAADRPVDEVCAEALPWTWGAFAVALLSGAALFSAQPLEYAANAAFRAKLLFVAAAGANMALFHLVAARDLPRWRARTRPPAAARLAGALSLLCWTAAIVCGRLIGYLMEPR